MPTFVDLVHAQMRAEPDAAAVIDGDTRLTYRDLDHRSAQVANALAAEGVGVNDRVALLFRNAAEFFELLVGVSRRNAVLVPLNFRLTTTEIAQILGDAEARVLIVSYEYRDRVDVIRDAVPSLRTILVLGGSSDGYQSWRDAHPTNAPTLLATTDQVALLMYTSGTTGTPKGVMISNENWNAAVAAHQDLYAMNSRSVQVFALPLFHIGGLLIMVLAMSAGACTVLLPDGNPGAIIAAASRHQATHLLVVPVLLTAILEFLDDPEPSSADLSHLRTVFYGASAMPEALMRRAIERFTSVRFMSGYGGTETTASMTFLRPDDHDVSDPRAAQRLRSVGRVSELAEVRIVDPDTGADLPTGQTGEIWLRGPQIARGYWRLPGHTAHAFGAQGWYRTGDGGYLDQDGYLVLTDRIKDMFISGGENVYPTEVEHALLTIPGVREAVVIGVPHERLGESGKAFVVLTAGVELTDGELTQACRERLAGYKCPTSIERVDQLPRTASGKVMRHVLRARLRQPTASTAR
ncbi:MAG TPA: long-chain-fatty-acid--CoA ligase [Pseudonocardia sp.]